MCLWAATIREKVKYFRRDVTNWMNEYTTAPTNGDADFEDVPLSSQEIIILESHVNYILSQADYCKCLRDRRTQTLRSNLRSERDNDFDDVISKIRNLKQENTKMKAELALQRKMVEDLKDEKADAEVQLEAQRQISAKLKDEIRRDDVVIGRMGVYITELKAKVVTLRNEVTRARGLGGQDGALGLGVQLDGQWQVVVDDFSDEVEYKAAEADSGSDGISDTDLTLVEHYESEDYESE